MIIGQRKDDETWEVISTATSTLDVSPNCVRPEGGWKILLILDESIYKIAAYESKTLTSWVPQDVSEH